MTSLDNERLILDFSACVRAGPGPVSVITWA